MKIKGATMALDQTAVRKVLAGVACPGGGDLIMDPMRTYLMVGSGPLIDDWKVDTIHGMSGNNLVLSGEEGLMNCEKKSKS